MTRALRLIAPAKVNWSLEVLHARPDGYHEIRSVLQTISLRDTVTLTEAAEITLELTGEPDMLEGNPPAQNLAYRAAVALRERAGLRKGAHIVLEKRVPVAAGLGGGSSDAAAVLRGLNELWDAGQPKLNLVEIAGEIGSDPPFFVVGGTAIASGRGDAVEALPDAIAPSIMLAIPPAGERGEKTAQMFGALKPEHYTDGDVSIGVRETVEAGRVIHDELLNNVFEHVTSRMQPDAERAMNALRSDGYSPHLCGAGPSFFLLYGGGADLADVLARRIRETGFDPRPAHVLRREQALRIEEL
ncbi:MAG: 4-(cytidine 5'-diphospho)-2-C-methyl-D-erythritol kinase [Chloroflexi bacterium]|nr:4-(cytidine 5'-diphospho)-2-C-methyl-D-erythritol kinase [Chloroflexota bacterium]